MNALTTRREIFFIDARIEGYESILVGMDPAADTHILNQQTDGMSQILDTLAQSDSRYDAVHLITHGSSAQIDLPGTLINADNLQQHKASLERIGGHLSADADFLVYGCNIGGDEAGRLFTQEFSKILGVDVATSDDLTGAQALGGDAVLEVRSGRIETPAIAEEIWDESAVLLVREKEPNYGTTVASDMGTLRTGGEVEGIGHLGKYVTNDGPKYKDYADYFKFKLSSPASVEFDLSASNRDVAMRLWLGPSSSLSLLQADTRSDFSKELSKGTYYVRVGYDESDWSNSFSNYELTVTASSAPTPPTPPRISPVSDESAEEGNTLRFTVTLDRAPSETTTYYYATYRSTAQGNDYDGHLATPLVFRAGDRSETIRVQTREDTQDENDETFDLYITDSRSDHPSSGRPSNYLARATGTIRDDDDAPTPPRISPVSDESAEEGNTLRFTVTLDRAPSETTTYYYATYRSTAQGNDYDGHLATPLVFRAGDRSETIRVQTREDTQDENDETFDLYITDSRSDHPSSGRPSNYLARATGTIIDDDDAPTPPRISPVSDESAEEGNTLRFTVTLDRAPSETTTYYYATYRGTAQGNDYDGHLATPLVFRAGDRSETIRVQTREDTQDENDETFDLYITDSRSDHPSSGRPSNYLARATGTIRDDDDAPTPPRISPVSDESAEEGNTLRFTVTLDRAPSETTTYYYATYRSTAQGNDYDGHLATPLVFRAGDRSETIRVQTREDTQDENDETFDLYITDSRSDHPSSGRPSNYLARATGTIIDDDDAPTPSPSPDISVSVSDESAEEGNTLRFTVTLDRAPSETTTYYYATYRSTAQGNDYDGHLATPLVFRAGDRSETIRVQTREDTQDENDETFDLYITDSRSDHPSSGRPSNYLARATGTIRDDDDAPTPPRIFSVSDESEEEGDTLEFTVTLDRAPSEATTYRFATYRAGAQGDDFHSLNSQLTFSSGQTRKNIEVRTIEDTQDEGNEIFYLYVADFGEAPPAPSSQSFQSSRNRGTGTIIDDDDAPTPSPSPDISVSVSDESAMEGETLRFTVALDRAPSETTTYYYATYRSSAGSNDYVGRVDSITFSPGESISQTIEVQTIADRLIDENYEEQFYLYVTDAENKLPVRGTPEDSLGLGIGRIRDVDQDSIPQDNPSIIPPDNPDSIPANIPSEPVSYRSSLEFALNDISLGPSFGLKLDDLYGEGDGSVNVRFLGDYDYAWDAGFLLELGGGVGSYDLRYDFDVLPEISGSGTGIEFSTSDWEAADALDLSFDGLNLYAKTRLGFEFQITHDTEVYDWDYWTEIDLLSHDIEIGSFAGIDISAPDISGTLLRQHPQYRGGVAGLPELVAGGSDDVFRLDLDLDAFAQLAVKAAIVAASGPVSPAVVAALARAPADVLEFELGPLAVTILDVAVRGEIDLVQEVRFSPEVRVDLYTPSGSLFQSKRLGDTFDLGSWGADDIEVKYTLGGDLTHRIGIEAEAKLLGEYLKAQGSVFGVNIDLGADNTFEKNIAETDVFWLYEPDPSEIIVGSRSYTYQLPSASSTPNPPSNGPPQISLQYFTVTEGTASVGRVIASDPEGGAVSYSLLSVGDYALFDITSEGVISFRVAPDYEAPRDSNNDNIYGVTVQVQDSAHQFASAPVRISVNNEVSDDPQLAISTLAIAVQEGEQVTLTRQMIDVQLTNQQTNNAVVFHVQEVRHGTFFLNGRFTTTFTQADIISRAVVFRHDGSEQAPTFKIAVSMLGRDSVTYQDAEDITFTPINDAPRTKADYIQSAGGQVTIQVLENDVDPEGDSLEISRINDVSDGIATIDGQNIDYTPRERFVGNEEFTYEVQDDNGGISRGYVTVRVTGEPNTAPVAMDDSVSTEAGRQVKILVLNNDADVNQDPLEITGVSEAAHGTVSIVNNAYLRYRPDADFTGTETLTYFISDSQGGTDTGSVSIQVNPVDEPPVNPPEPVSQNNAPVAIYDEFTIAEDIASVSLDVLENDYDVDDGDTLSLMRAMASSGEASVRDNRIFYTPLADYDGNVRITYQVSDGSSIVQGLALLSIRPVNDAPTLTDSSIREISALPGESLQLDSVAGWFRDVDADISAYSIHTGALPSGLSLNPSTGKWIGSISPHQQTTQYAFTVRATDSAGTYADQAVQISARDALLLYTSGSTGSDVMVVGSSLEAVANGGAGADHYVIPSGMFGNIRIIDQFGDNTLAFDQGVEIASVQQDFSILTVTLTDDNTIQISRPEGYTYALGSEAGLSLSQFMGRVDTGFFVTDLVAVPTTPESPADALQIYLNGNPNTDAFTLGFNQEARANGGAGADVYSISRFQKGNVEIEDLFGNNLIHFESGVQITETGLNLGTARLTLSTGAVVTVRDATTQKYQAGDGSVMTHAEFQAWVADSGTVPTSILIRGTAANNNLTGADQAEILYGFAGNDVLKGGGGSDVLNGGLGDDSLTGGSGSDSFVYGIRHTGREWNGRDGEDTILDFSIADNDKLKLLDAQGIVSSIAHLEQGYDDAQYQVRVRDADLMLVAFANVRQSENGATGSNQLKITLTENIDTSLYDANTGRFNDFDAFVDALGGDDSILFA